MSEVGSSVRMIRSAADLVRGQRHLGELLVASLFINIVGLALPLAMLQVYDRILPNQSHATLDMLVLGVGAAIVIEALLRQSRESLAGLTAARFTHRGHAESLRRLLGMSMPEFEKEGSGSQLERLGAIDKLADQIGGRTLLAVVDAPFVLVFVGVIGFLGGYLALVPLGTAFVFVALSLLQSRMLGKATEDTAEQDERRYNFMLETLSGIHTVKAMAAESQMLRRFERLLDNTIDSRHTVALRNGSVQILGGLLSQITTALTVGFGAMLVVQQEMTVGSLAACTMLAGRVAPPVQAAVQALLRRRTTATARRRVEETFALRVEDNRLRLPALDGPGRLTLEGVGHGRLFDGVDLTLEPGQAISIRGGNGSGKSLLLWLMTGQVPPERGRVTIGGQDLSEVDTHSLQHAIGLLPEQGSLINGTLLENLTLFDPDREASALAVAEELGLNDIAATLPQGFDAPMGGRIGSVLPRGVVQRVAIARVMALNPGILLFDDANALLDGASDQLLMEALRRRKGRQSLVIVSHRPSTLKLADRHFELQDGRLVEITESSMFQAVPGAGGMTGGGR